MNMATEKELLAAIAEVEKQAAPLRKKREALNAESEARRLEARKLSTQILTIEDRAQVLRFELKMQLKRQGRLTQMAVTPK
jgi:hypothetical protein